MLFEYISAISTLLTVFTGGGWFIYYRANKRKAMGEAAQSEAEANKLAQEYYNKTLEDANKTIQEVRAERDHYKDDRNNLEKENDEIRKKYTILEEQLSNIAIDYKKAIAKLEQKIDALSPFLCGVVGCLHRKRVNILEETEQDNNKDSKDGND